MKSPFERDFSRGFLPPVDPLPRLPAPFDAWEDVAGQLSKLALTDWLRPTIRALPPFPLDALADERQAQRALVLLSYMASMVVLQPGQPTLSALPAPLAPALVAVAARLGVPPILSYATQTMYNWRRLNPDGPLAVGNLTLLQNFLGGMDEEWFVTLHINIEAVAGRGLAALRPAQRAAALGRWDELTALLRTVAETLDAMAALLQRMPERCDPDIYYHRVRPYMFGWKDHPELPGGLVYEGVPALGDQPQGWRGETGAQTGTVPAFDAALGIVHEMDDMRAYLLEMRDYMPPADRAYVEGLEQRAVHPRLCAQQRAASEPRCTPPTIRLSMPCLPSAACTSSSPPPTFSSRRAWKARPAPAARRSPFI